jgi:hypothetical protein
MMPQVRFLRPYYIIYSPVLFFINAFRAPSKFDIEAYLAVRNMSARSSMGRIALNGGQGLSDIAIKLDIDGILSVPKHKNKLD